MQVEDNDIRIIELGCPFEQERSSVAFSRPCAAENHGVALKEAIATGYRQCRPISYECTKNEFLFILQPCTKESHEALKICPVYEMAYAIDLGERIRPTLECIGPSPVDGAESADKRDAYHITRGNKERYVRVVGFPFGCLFDEAASNAFNKADKLLNLGTAFMEVRFPIPSRGTIPIFVTIIVTRAESTATTVPIVSFSSKSKTI
jgi:hypothetical protein